MSSDAPSKAPPVAAAEKIPCSVIGFNYVRAHDSKFDFREERGGSVVLETTGDLLVGHRSALTVKTGLRMTRYDDCVPANLSPHLTLVPNDDVVVAPAQVRLGEEIVLEMENDTADDFVFPALRVIGEMVLIQRFDFCANEDKFRIKNQGK
jgi:hypothetical protein